MQDCCALEKHNALFYSSQTELLDFLMDYFKSGLQNNELCLWAIPDKISIEQAKDALRTNIDNLDRYIENGQLVIGDHKKFYFKNDVFTAYDTIKLWAEQDDFAKKSGFKGICVSGDGSWALEDFWFSLFIYEKEIEKTIHLFKMKAVCSYDLGRLDLDKIYEIIAAHQTSLVNRAGQWVALEADHLKKNF